MDVYIFLSLTGWKQFKTFQWVCVSIIFVTQQCTPLPWGRADDLLETVNLYQTLTSNKFWSCAADDHIHVVSCYVLHNMKFQKKAQENRHHAPRCQQVWTFQKVFCLYSVLLNCDFHQCQTPRNIKSQKFFFFVREVKAHRPQCCDTSGT